MTQSPYGSPTPGNGDGPPHGHGPWDQQRPQQGYPAHGQYGYQQPGEQPPPGYGPGPAGPYGGPYGQPYGPPPTYGPRTNTMAIIALVAAFVFAPAGLILGILALREINRTGEEGRGLAMGGAIVGGVITGFMVLGFVGWFGLFASFASWGY